MTDASRVCQKKEMGGQNRRSVGVALPKQSNADKPVNYLECFTVLRDEVPPFLFFSFFFFFFSPPLA